jgi:protein MYSM1
MNPKRSSRNGEDNTISKDKEEEMSSALIAQMLAEDAISHENDNYYAEYSNNSNGYVPYQNHKDQGDSFNDNESSEDEFDPALEQKQLKKEAGKKKKKKKKKKNMLKHFVFL